MLSLTPDARIESIFETTSQTPTSVAPLPMSAPTLTPSTITTWINEAVKVAVQLQSDRLYDEAQKENDDFLKTIDENIQKIIKKQVKEQVTGGPRDEEKERSQKNESATAEEPMLTTHEMEEPSHSEFETGADDQPIVKPSQHPECELAKQSDSRSSFNELMDTPVDFFAFLMNRLKLDTLTLELLAGPTYELMKGSCKSLVELEFFLEEVYKITIDQLDWVNPEGQQYPHNLLKPLPLIPNSRGRHVIPFDHFINNDLEYLRRGASSHKYTTSVTKKKASDYGHIKWIEDLVPRTMWIQEPTFNSVAKVTRKLNLTRPDTYRSDLNRKEAYIAYFNPRGFIYQNKDKQNRLMRIDELHNFSDGMLTDVRTALDDHLKRI
uniref:Uncharacterized protein n=1 Tax=Tanacetum cinerariifolium TaxID=118510 RepID=A0A699KZ08_TANCI|nr:hypothetical protein [Tanacetum cinerariifolium]